MIRKLLVVFAILSLGVTAAAAQSCQDVIDKRQALMKKSAAVGKDGSAMIKGDTPFDLAKAQAILATFAEDAAALPSLFPDCSKTGENTTAAPAIWDRPDDFKAAIAKFAADVKAAQDNDQRPRQLQDEFPDHRQELRLLPSDFPCRKELNAVDRLPGAAVRADVPPAVFCSVGHCGKLPFARIMGALCGARRTGLSFEYLLLRADREWRYRHRQSLTCARPAATSHLE